jgi:hypothetical protein
VCSFHDLLDEKAADRLLQMAWAFASRGDRVR